MTLDGATIGSSPGQGVARSRQSRTSGNSNHQRCRSAGVRRSAAGRGGNSVRRGMTPGRAYRASHGGLVSASEHHTLRVHQRCQALRVRRGVHASPLRCGGAGDEIRVRIPTCPFTSTMAVTVAHLAYVHLQEGCCTRNTSESKRESGFRTVLCFPFGTGLYLSLSTLGQ